MTFNASAFRLGMLPKCPPKAPGKHWAKAYEKEGREIILKDIV